MDFAWFLTGFHLVYCPFFKFANGLDCEQSPGLDLGWNLPAARGDVNKEQGTGLGLRKPEVQ